MAPLSPEAALLLARITRAIEICSAEEHRMRRDKVAYQRAATELRTGRSPGVVMALLAEGLGLALEALEILE